MPSKRLIPGLNKRSRQPKAVTPLQRQQLRLQKRDEDHTRAAHQELLARLNQQETTADHDPGPAQQTDHIHDDVNAADDFADHEVGVDTHPDFDMNQFLPGFWHHQREPKENDAMVIELQRQTHLANRLAHENRWAWQYAIMLPSFLRARLETSNWGNEARWNYDFRPRCSCGSQTERDVDLVDLLSE